MKRGNKPYSVTFESLVMRLVKQTITSFLERKYPPIIEAKQGLMMFQNKTAVSFTDT